MKITAGKIVLVVLVLLGIGIYFGIPHLVEYTRRQAQESFYGPVVQEVVETGRVDRKVFDGPSSELKQTTIVPSLQSKLDKGRNVIWCASFDMAWTELKALYPPNLLQVKGAEEAVALLNNSPIAVEDLPDQSFYAAAGFLQNGIVAKIQKEMNEQYPGEIPPSFGDIDPSKTESIAYSYLQASLPFAYPYFDNDAPLLFKTSEGRETKVTSFGIREKDGSKFFRLRKQVKVMYVKWDRNGSPRPNLLEYAIDLCRDSKPDQIVLAYVEPKDTLAGTVEYVESQKPDELFRKGEFGPNDSLLIPNLFWKIDHSFHELEGDKIQKAEETIEFRLNRSGAELKAHSNIAVSAGPLDFVFDKPFLIYMKKRGAERPYFAAWIGNEELLTRWAEAGK
jgi:hypothetical protein